MKVIISLLVLLVVSSGYYFNESFAEISENQAFLLEGSGYAVTEEFIRISEIDLGLSSQQQSGSTIDFLTEDGFVTLDNTEFVISELEGKFLREGRYIRLNGNIESPSGFDTSISFFGRLVDESKDAAVYGFTGRITTPDDSYKVIYTTKLSTLSKIDITSMIEQSEALTIHILTGSSSPGVASSYIEGSSIQDQATLTQSPADPLRRGYFSDDRISVEPGTTITIVNDDVVSHSIISGKENYGSRYDQFTPDGRISTGKVVPGESVSITFDDAGFYRLYDPDYNWMKIVAYVFPNSDSLILGQSKNLGN
ncbi:MAG: plastocyanin/azurin family copper-binding protein [Nitrosopumilus sp.]|nr:plastocyanin/azurin family copper-binding protein [Nitrosopumilus sp.]MDH3822204.1 plastocyanin/azurin family copper-binding protein [Nitrosopumilus sp.]